MENSKNKHFLGVTWHAVLRSVVKSGTTTPAPFQDMNNLTQHIHAVYAAHLLVTHDQFGYQS